MVRARPHGRHARMSDILPLCRTSGGPGRGSEKGGEARLAPGISSDVLKTAAIGWESMEAKIFGSAGHVASSGGLTTSDKRRVRRSGGGGGGYNGGWAAEDGALPGEREEPKHSSGGGGASFCNGPFVEACDLKTGGNEAPQGVVTIQAYRCF